MDFGRGSTMGKGRVGCGRTEAAKKLIQTSAKVWFDREISENTESGEAFEHLEIQKFLDYFDYIRDNPFRRFIVRYLLDVYGEMICPKLFSEMKKEEWLDTGSELILNEMDRSEGMDYADSPEILKKLADEVFNIFVQNSFYIKYTAETPFRVLGAVSRGIPSKGKKKFVKLIEWDRNDILQKLRAKKLAVDFSDSTDLISDDAFFAFAFGLDMEYEDIVLFMTKVLRRTTFNLWNWREFLLYISYRYAKGSRYQFYLKIKEAYEDEKNTARKPKTGSMGEELSTRMVQSRVGQILEKLEDGRNIALDEDGKLPEEVIQCICEYKYIIQNAGDYMRTAVRKGQELLMKFEEYADRDLQMKKADNDVDDDYYEISRELEHREERYYNEALDTNISKGFIRTKTAKSEKPDEKKKEKDPLPEQKAMGKVIITCDEDTSLVIPAGTIFTKIEKKTGRKVEFRSLEDRKIESADEKVCVEIWVESVGSGKGCDARKNEITQCSIENWQKKFKLENKRIGFKQKPKQSGAQYGKICNYLYYSGNLDDLSNYMDQERTRKLGEVLEGTRLTDTKLSQIRRGKAAHISRNDLMTLNFLVFTYEIDEIEDPDAVDASFRQRTNDLLTECGYYELYEPNPYEAFLLWLINGEDRMYWYQSLWSWYNREGIRGKEEAESE